MAGEGLAQPWSRAPASARFRLVAAGLAVLLVAGCVYTSLHQTRWGYDDAFISYRYAEHLAEGHGLVFNPGERVEGYSNLLYVLAMAVGLTFVPREAIYGVSVTTNIACLLGALAITLTLVRRRSGEVAASMAGMAFSLSLPLWLAAWSGMETSLVVLLFTGLWLAVSAIEAGDRSGAPLAWLLPLIVLCRADGFVTVFILVVYFSLRRESGLAAFSALLGGGTYLLQLGARLLYYGDPLPNTYYVKVASPLLERLGYAWQKFQGFVELHPWLLLLFALALWRAVRARSSLAGLDFATFFAGSWLLYWFFVGGDVFGSRFLLVLLPLGFAAFADLVPRAPAGRLLTLGWLLALVALPFLSGQLQTQRMAYDPWSELGRFLQERHAGSLIAVDAAGKIPYYSRLRAIDMLGLTDAHIARTSPQLPVPGHGKFDPDYVFAREPDLIAALVVNSDFDLGWRLPAERYHRQGYRLAYVQSFVPEAGAPAIVDASRLTRRELRQLYERQYRYAVLVRRRGPE